MSRRQGIGDREQILILAHLVAQAAGTRTLALLLDAEGLELSVDGPLHGLAPGLQVLLARAQEVGAVRCDVGIAEVLALLVSACQGALRGGWDRALRQRVVAIIFDGLRPPG